MQFLIEEVENYDQSGDFSQFRGNIGGESWELMNQNVKRNIFSPSENHSLKASVVKKNNSDSKPKKPSEPKVKVRKKSIKSSSPCRQKQKHQEQYRQMPLKIQMPNNQPLNPLMIGQQPERRSVKGIRYKLMKRSKTQEKQKDEEKNKNFDEDYIRREKNKARRSFTHSFPIKKKKLIINSKQYEKKQEKSNTRELRIYTKENLSTVKKIHSHPEFQQKKRILEISNFHRLTNPYKPTHNSIGLSIWCLQPKSKKIIL